ncbi:20931_t:CDS:1 [Dentiscutata erythropus]|uniref:20931_t:CDS:1 n=1 Tax=Dentiscutata erythropus TaxID=1348616 RepID=A0A9N9EDS7_9GLOM|nr:20931_t:CDS:1 [Dentiscutata erythropus]
MSEKTAAAGFEDGVVRVWDLNTGQVNYILKDTVEDVEQIMSTVNNDKSVNERVTCLQIIVLDNKSKQLSNQKAPVTLFATYRNGYFREWDLTSGQISHTVFTHQKGGISCLFVVDDDQDGIHIFTGAQDGSVKCWIRMIDLDNKPKELCNNVWKLLYTLRGKSGNAITGISAKVIKTEKGCFGVVVTGAADGEVRVYDYLTGQFIETLSYGTSGKQNLAKEHNEQQRQKKFKTFSSEQDWFEEDEDENEFWDEIESFDSSHQGAIISIIIHPLKEESCPCGDIEESRGFSIITSSLDEKVNFWQLTRKFVDCTCMTSQLEEPPLNYNDNVDTSERFQKVFLGHIRQPGSSVIVLLKGHIIGVRRTTGPNASIKRSHGAEGEWEVWAFDINDPNVFEPTEEIDFLENYDDDEFKVKTIPLVNDSDLIIEQQKKKKEIYKQDRENMDKLKGFVGRRKVVSMTNKNYLSNSSHSDDQNENHSYIHNEEDYVQGQVMDFRQRSQKQRVYPNNSHYDRISFKEEDVMNEMLPFSRIRRIVKVGEDGLAVTYGNFVKVIMFKELNDC